MLQLRLGNRTILLVLVISTLLVLIPNIPIVSPIPNIDSGVFLYMGQAMNRGSIPYVDVWDHKGLALYALNAAATLLTPQSGWGIWIIDAVLLLIGTVAGYSVMKARIGKTAAFLSGIAWLFLMTTAPLNVPEFYAIPLGLLAFYCVDRSEQVGQGWKYGLVLGVIFALLFFIRPNLVATLLAIGLYWLWELVSSPQRSASLQRIGFFIVGAAIVTGVIIGYLVITHSFQAMIAEFFTYNFAYSGGNSLQHVATSVMTGLNFESGTGLGLFALAGWLVSVIILILKPSQRAALPTIVKVAIIALPAEIVASSISGRTYAHYYLAWLPALAILCAYFIAQLWNRIESQPGEGSTLSADLMAVLLAIGIVAAPVITIAYHIYNRPSTNTDFAEVIDVVDQQTSKDDTLLVWGAEAEINYLTGVPSPTRYVYQFPLFLPQYESAAHFGEFLSDLEKNPPKLIADISSDSGGVPLDDAARANWTPTNDYVVLNSDADPIFTYVDANYSLLTKTTHGWSIYIRNS